MPLVPEGAAQVGEQPDDPPLRLVVLHQGVEDPDLAGGAVVDERAVEQRDDRVGIREAFPVFAKIVPGDVSAAASAFSCGTKTSIPSVRSRAAHSSMNDRSYGVKSGPAKYTRTAQH